MADAWESVPDWATVVADWGHALEGRGASASTAVVTLDVVADAPSALAGLLDRPGAWLRREDVDGARTITSARLHQLLAETGGPRPAADELAHHLARIGGDRELVAALLMRATALGYPASRGETLRAIGELAGARLEVEGIELVRQGGRPRLMVHGGEIRLPSTYEQTIHGLAHEHAAMLTELRPVRFRAFVERDGRRRAASVDELRGGLPADLGAVAQGAMPTALDPVDEDGTSAPVRFLDADRIHDADETVRRSIRDAVVDAIFERATPIQQIEKEPPDDSWIADYPPFSITLVAIRDDGYLVNLVDDEPAEGGAPPVAITVLVDPRGRLSAEHRRELARFVAEVSERVGRSWGRSRLAQPGLTVPAAALRITPLTDALLRLVRIEAAEDLDFERGERGAEDARPLSFQPIGRYGVAVHGWRVHAARVAIACPVNGGVIFRDDGHVATATVPRPVGPDAVERELADVLRTPALESLVGAFVDHVACDERGWSVLYVRGRPEPLDPEGTP